jgi:hypothetical protein
MKLGYVLVFSFLTVRSLAQSTIAPNNPLPRIGERIDLEITFKRESLAWLEQKERKTAEENVRLEQNRIASGSLKISQVMNDTGLVTIGPFRFTIGDQTYEAPPVALRVIEALPDSEHQGIWVRTAQFGRYQYIIIEQRIPNSWKRSRDGGNTISMSAEGVQFSEFLAEKLEIHGLELVHSMTSTDHQVLNQPSASVPSTVAYKQAIYRYRRPDDFRSAVKIDKTYFKDVPKTVKVQEAWIR